LLPPDLETLDALRRPHGEGRSVRVIVVGATARSGSATVAAMLADSLTMAGLGNDSVGIVHAGATLDGLHAAVAGGAWKFVVVTGGSAATLTAGFAVIKAIEARTPGARIELLVTGLEEARAHAAYLRVRSAAERFLGRDLVFAGAIMEVDIAPADGSDDAGSTRRRATRASRAARMWAARLLAECSEGAWPDAAHSMN
jgi:hypothetical protein